MSKNQSTTKILIGIWGNPYSWKEINYKYYKDNLVSKKSKSSLSIIKEVEDPKHIVIIISDTLLNALLDQKNNNFSFSIDQIKDYKSIKNLLKNSIDNFCKDNFSFKADEVIISYGFGEFDKTKFIGNAMDFYYNLFKELAFYFTNLISELGKDQKNIEVILDATHGINYNLILTYRSLVQVLVILAYYYDVKLKVLNSDPLVGTYNNNLNINVILETKILPNLSVFRHDKRPIKPYFNLNDNQKKEIGLFLDQFFENNFCLNYKEDVYIFLSSFMYGLPTLIFSYFIDFSEIKKSIELISKKFEENIEIISLGKIELKRSFEYTETFANLVKTFIFSYILNIFNFNKLEDIPLSKIKKISDIFFKNFPIEKNRIDKEIKDIEDISKDIEYDYNVYIDIRSKSKDQNQDISSNKNDNKYIRVGKRNFFAHSGFEYNSIKIKKLGNEIYIKINDDKKGEINSLILNSLPKI